MNRGEVWWVSFGPSVGGEIQKKRPAIIISNDASNKHLNRVQVVPVTSNVARIFPSEALVQIGKRKSKALADQLATVSKERLVNKTTKLSTNDLKKVEQAIRVQLGLS